MIALRKSGKGQKCKMVAIPKNLQKGRIGLQRFQKGNLRPGGFWNPRFPLRYITNFCEGSGLLFHEQYYLYSSSKYKNGKLYARTYRCYSYLLNRCPAKVKEYVDSEEISMWSQSHFEHTNLKEVVRFFTLCLKDERFEYAAVSFLRSESGKPTKEFEFSEYFPCIPDLCRIFVEQAILFIDYHVSEPRFSNEKFVSDCVNLILNISSVTGEAVTEILKYNVLPYISRILSVVGVFSATGLRTSTIWCLGNILGENAYSRQYAVNIDLLSILMNILEENISFFSPFLVEETKRIKRGDCCVDRKGVIVLVDSDRKQKMKIPDIERDVSEQLLRTEELRQLFWTFSNFFRGKIVVSFTILELTNFLEKISMFLCFYDQKVIIDLFWTLSYISETKEIFSDLLLKIIDLEVLVSLLDRFERIGVRELLIPVLRLFGNLSTCKANITNRVIFSSRYLDVVLKMLKGSSCSDQVLRELAWTFSNLSCDSEDNNTRIMEKGIYAEFFRHLNSKIQKLFPMKKEIIYTINNVFSGKHQSERILKHFVGDLDVFNTTLRFLGKYGAHEIGDTLVIPTLETLKKIMETGSTKKPYWKKLRSQSVKTLNTLCKSIDTRISRISNWLVEHNPTF